MGIGANIRSSLKHLDRQDRLLVSPLLFYVKDRYLRLLITRCLVDNTEYVAALKTAESRAKIDAKWRKYKKPKIDTYIAWCINSAYQRIHEDRRAAKELLINKLKFSRKYGHLIDHPSYVKFEQLFDRQSEYDSRRQVWVKP